MSPVRRLLAPLLLALAVAPAAPAAELRPGPTAEVVEVIDGDTVVLDDCSQVRLVGIQAPKLPLGRPGFPTWPMAPEARAALERMLLGKRVTLAFGGAERDRHGRHLAHLFLGDHVADEGWVQGAMLRQGLARVYTFPDNRARIGAMLAVEGEARAARRGIWRLDAYRILAPGEAGARIGDYVIVEGRVRDAAAVKRRVFLNFGEDWKTDFTVVIEREAQRPFRAAGVDPLALEGRTIRVRGWLRSWNGPSLEVTHPEQIEPLPEAGATEASGEASAPAPGTAGRR